MGIVLSNAYKSIAVMDLTAPKRSSKLDHVDQILFENYTLYTSPAPNHTLVQMKSLIEEYPEFSVSIDHRVIERFQDALISEQPECLMHIDVEGHFAFAKIDDLFLFELLECLGSQREGMHSHD